LARQTIDSGLPWEKLRELVDFLDRGWGTEANKGTSINCTTVGARRAVPLPVKTYHQRNQAIYSQ
jgi:hypothetical protein